jgi:hypothetical protein
MAHDVSTVADYIASNILHSSVWDEATPTQKTKAVNNAVSMLLTYLPDKFPTADSISTEFVAHQAVWMLRIDDTFLRAELGISYIQMSGVMVTIADKDRSINPYILSALKISVDSKGGITKKKVARYTGTRDLGSPYSNLRRGN